MDSPRPPSILIVDDDRDACANLSDIFTDQGYRVDVAYDGEAALALVAGNVYDVALLDLKLPGIDGVELFRRIRQLQPATVGIIVTAFATVEATDEALRAGACHVLSKPVNFHALLSLVRESLDRPLVLVVDDDLELCDLLRDLFGEHRYRVALAHDVPTAEKQLRERRFHVVLVDLKLPRGDGGEVVRTVRSANDQSRVVLITGHRTDMESALHQVLAEGADAVCYKPFDVGRLLDTVGRLARQVPRPEAVPPLPPR